MMSGNHPIRSFTLDNLLLFALGHLAALPSIHHRLATVWGDDGKSRFITSADNDA